MKGLLNETYSMDFSKIDFGLFDPTLGGPLFAKISMVTNVPFLQQRVFSMWSLLFLWSDF
jgi:hypothetical protein